MANVSTSKNQFLVRTYVKGFKELSKMLTSFTDESFRSKALLEAGRKTLKPLMEKIRSAAPVLEGDMLKKNPNTQPNLLKNSIKFRAMYNIGRKIKTGKYKALSMYEYAGQIYTGRESEEFAKIVEYGRPSMGVVRNIVFGKKVAPYKVRIPAVKPNPFMRKTLDANYYRLLVTYKKVLRIAIDKKKKKEVALVNKARRKELKDKNGLDIVFNR